MSLIGTDGIAPIIDNSGRWCWWGIDDIYVGTIGDQRYVPKVLDYVMDPATFTVYKVVSIDPTTLRSTLTEISINTVNTTLSQQDILFGVGSGTSADTYRAYIDKTTLPYTLAVDARLKISGSASSYCKIFKGTDTSNGGTVVSAMYDSAGNFLTNNVILNLAAIDNTTNTSIRSVGVCNTVISLNDGEVITVVIYNSTGQVISKRQLLVEVSSFIRAINASTKYVSHIGLKCAFLSATVDRLIEFPMNIPVASLDLMGVVYYSDGTSVTLPVDGSKFKVLGLDQYVSTILGQKIDLVLSYSLSATEQAYGAVSADGKFMSSVYNLVTTAVQGSYSVKLFGYPTWINAISGYTMKWFLYNLDRNLVFDATPYVSFNPSGGPFNPIGYGLLQRLSVSVNLHNVSTTFNSYVHTQSIDIYLKQQADNVSTLWNVGLDSGVTNTLFGEGLYATALHTVQDTYTVNLGSGIATYAEWYQRMVTNTYPLFNSATEVAAPIPDFFAIVFNGTRNEFPIINWNLPVSITNGSIAANSTLFIEFFKRTPTNDIQVSVAGMPIRTITA